MALPRILLIAGSDSSGGAGIEADQKVVAAHKCYAMTATTAMTAQNTLHVRQMFHVPPYVVKGQIEANLEDIGADVVKIGMLGTADMINEVAKSLKKYKVAVTVVDPVMVSTTGAELLPKAAVSYFRDSILPLATVLTPNVPEALKLLDEATERRPQLDTIRDMVTLAKCILKFGPTYVLLKGGHLPFTREGKVARKVKERQIVINVLCNEEKTYILQMDYQNAKNTHGTGCSLASAIACNLALFQATVGGEDLMLRAVESACGFVEVGIRTAANIGKGNGPINHFHGSLIVEKPKGPKNQKEQKKPKSPLQSTLTTEVWNSGSIKGSGADDNKALTREVTEVLNELYDQALEGREDSPQVGDLFIRTPPRIISNEEAQSLKEAAEEDRKAEKVEKAERAAKKAAAAVKKAAEAAKKAAEAAKKAAEMAERMAEQEIEDDAEEVQELVTKPKRRSTKGLATKPPRLAHKDPPIKRATAATKGLAANPVRRTAKTAQQQTVMEAGEEEGVVEASKDASKKVESVPKNCNSGAPIALPSNSGAPIALPSDSVNRSAKAFPQKTSQKAGEKKIGDEEDSDEIEVVSENVVTKQITGPIKGPTSKPVKRRSKATEQGILDVEMDQVAGPSQAPAPKRAQKLRLTFNRDNPNEAGKAADDEIEEVDVDEYTAAKNDALKKDDELTREVLSKKVRPLKRKAGDMLSNDLCLFSTSNDAPWDPKKVKR